MVEMKAFRLESNFPPMRALEFIRDHVTFKLPYDFSYHMKTPNKADNFHKESINFQTSNIELFHGPLILQIFSPHEKNVTLN